MQIITRKHAIELGLKRFFTGKPCIHGHVCERYSCQGKCVECGIYSAKKRIEKHRVYCNKKYHSIPTDEKTKLLEKIRVKKRDEYFKNPEKFREISRRYQRNNREKTTLKSRLWYKNNPDLVSEYNQRKDRKDMARYHANRYRAIKLKSTPIWANLSIIESIYINCQDGHQVDHIVPLISDIVCGLHCESNLQYLTEFDNKSKGNRWWPDMP